MRSAKEQSFATPSNGSPQIKWWAMLGIGLGVLMFTIDTSIVNIALPTLVQDLHTSFAVIQWVVLSYLLIVTALVLGAARLGDIFGKKRLYIGGLILFTISSLLCGLAPSVDFLIGFRAIQGLGAVFISGLGAAIITEIFPNSERGRALGMIGAIVSLGVSLGPTVGGLLIGLYNWRLLFLVNVPIGILASLIIIRFVPSSAGSQAKQSFDGLGTVIITVTLICFSLGMTYGQIEGFGSRTTLAMLVFAGISLVCFLAIEVRLKQPMLDLQIFRNLQFSLSLLLGLLVFIVIGAVIFVLPFFLEWVKHYSTQKVGLLLAVAPVLGGLVAPLSGSLSDRFGSRLISLIGLVLMTGGCLLMSTFDTQLTVLGYILRTAPFGIGFGVFQSPNNSAIMGGVPRERLGIASGLLSLSRTLGQITGLPLIGALFATLTLTSAHLMPHTDVQVAPAYALVYGLQVSLRVAALILVMAAVLTAVLWRMERSSTQDLVT